MPVLTLSLTDFRSYHQLDIELAGGPHVVVGRNAAGKTNLVESLVLLSSGHSHRGGADTEMVRWGRDFARVAAVVEIGSRIEELEVVVLAAATGGGGRKRVRVNGVNRRPAALAGVLRTVLFAPEDMLLVSGPPSLRRNLLDDLVAQQEVTAATTLATYARALTQRNSLLKRIREEAAGRAELVYWDGVLCESGGHVLDWRQAALAALAEPLSAAHREIAPDEPPVSLRYVSSTVPRAAEGWADALRRRLHETADKESLERGHPGRAAPRRRHLRGCRPRLRTLRLPGPAAHRHPGPQAGRAGGPHPRRRPPPAPAARRRLQRARPRTPRTPGQAHREPATGRRDDDHARRP